MHLFEGDGAIEGQEFLSREMEEERAAANINLDNNTQAKPDKHKDI